MNVTAENDKKDILSSSYPSNRYKERRSNTVDCMSSQINKLIKQDDELTELNTFDIVC